MAKRVVTSRNGDVGTDAPRFVDYTDHAEQYGCELNPHEAGH